MRLADYLFAFLADHDIKNAFMVSGGGAMFLNDALGQQTRICHVCNHHEQASAIAAEGYARVTNRPAAVNVTTGPGGTNAITGVIGAWLDSLPVLFFSGQVKYPTTIASRPDLHLRQLGDQEINIVDLVKPVTKYAVMVTDPQTIRHELEKALWLATHGRKGPVWLDIPINVQSAEIDPESLVPFDPTSFAKELPVVSNHVVEQVMNALFAAQSPVIIAGHGIRLANAIPEFRELISRLPWPVLGTFNGFDLLPSDHPQAIGRIGTIGTRAGNFALQNADFILCLGTRNNIRQIGYNYKTFAKNAKNIVVVDIDSNELQKETVRPTLPVHADVKDFLRALLDQLGPNPTIPHDSWKKWLHWNQDRKERYPVTLPEYEKITGGTEPYYFCQKLTESLPDNAIVACTNATPSLGLFQTGVIKSHQRMFANSGSAAMGYGLPAATGAAMAAGNRPVICLEGDGSLMMNLQELQTVAYHNLPIKLFLFNNGEYASIRQTHDRFFQGRHTGCDLLSGVSFPNWEKVAAAFDWPYLRIDSHELLEEKIQTVLDSPSRIFCNVVLVPNYSFAPKIASRTLPDGSIVSSSLEDMFPFLSDDEMKNNIYQQT